MSKYYNCTSIYIYYIYVCIVYIRSVLDSCAFRMLNADVRNAISYLVQCFCLPQTAQRWRVASPRETQKHTSREDGAGGWGMHRKREIKKNDVALEKRVICNVHSTHSYALGCSNKRKTEQQTHEQRRIAWDLADTNCSSRKFLWILWHSKCDFRRRWQYMLRVCVCVYSLDEREQFCVCIHYSTKTLEKRPKMTSTAIRLIMYCFSLWQIAFHK